MEGKHSYNSTSVLEAERLRQPKSLMPEKTIQSTKYTGKNKKFDFTSYKAALDEAFRDLEEANLLQPDETKVFFLLNGIESESLKRVKDGIVTNPSVCNDYHEAILYI